MAVREATVGNTQINKLKRILRPSLRGRIEGKCISSYLPWFEDRSKTLSTSILSHPPTLSIVSRWHANHRVIDIKILDRIGCCSLINSRWLLLYSTVNNFRLKRVSRVASSIFPINLRLCPMLNGNVLRLTFMYTFIYNYIVHNCKGILRGNWVLSELWKETIFVWCIFSFVSFQNMKLLVLLVSLIFVYFNFIERSVSEGKEDVKRRVSLCDFHCLSHAKFNKINVEVSFLKNIFRRK